MRRLVSLLILGAALVGCSNTPSGSEGELVSPQELAKKQEATAPKDDIKPPTPPAAPGR